MSELKTRIQEDMKIAMKAQEKARLGAIRLILAAIKQCEVDERILVDDQRVLAILDKMLKQGRESLAQYQAAGRQDLVEKEQLELDIIHHYMPAALSDTEIEQLITEAITVVGAKSIQEMGKVMAHLKPQIQGRADAAQVSGKVKQRLLGGDL